jgi:hypothetical protein
VVRVSDSRLGGHSFDSRLRSGIFHVIHQSITYAQAFSAYVGITKKNQNILRKFEISIREIEVSGIIER